MSLLVSIHDVTPAWTEPVTALWRMCRGRGITPALLVVPDWHGEWPLERHPAFVDWLRERAAEGADVLLHGERHDERGLDRSPLDQWRALGRTAREGEFLTLGVQPARDRIERGLSRLRTLGLDPMGFVPPAWLAREATYQAAAESGLRIAEDRRAIRLLPAPTRLDAPVYCWSARRAWRAWGSLLAAEARYRLSPSPSLVRIALHPLDLSHPATAVSLSNTLDRWRSRREPTHYRDLEARR